MNKPMNTLYCGDNLLWLKSLPENHVDLIYLDPPFQSGKDYNMIFAKEAAKKKGATAQIKAFGDTWSWGEQARKEYEGLINGTLTKEPPRPECLVLMKAMMEYLGECSLMAYLCMMAPRLVEMRRVLKDTGSIYLHCDPTASHYLKLLMDAVFGAKNFRNEIVWKRATFKNFNKLTNIYGRISDRILFYAKSSKFTLKETIIPYTKDQIDKKFSNFDDNGRRFELQDLTARFRTDPEWIRTNKYEFCGITKVWRFTKEKMLQLDEQSRIWKKEGVIPRYKQYLNEFPEGKKGLFINDLWTDISEISSKEYFGYPTQKPEALLERIIKASSNEGDIVLDPFSGTGTTIAVAQKLGRQWIGIDISLIAIEVIVKRLAEKEQIAIEKDFNFCPWPSDEYSEESIKSGNPEAYEAWCKVMSAKANQADLGLLPKYDRNEILEKLGVKNKN